MRSPIIESLDMKYGQKSSYTNISNIKVYDGTELMSIQQHAYKLRYINTEFIFNDKTTIAYCTCEMNFGFGNIRFDVKGVAICSDADIFEIKIGKRVAIGKVRYYANKLLNNFMYDYTKLLNQEFKTSIATINKCLNKVIQYNERKK